MAKDKGTAAKDSVLGQARRLVDGLAGARLCYGEPIEAGGRTVIPVARVHATGGYGFGRGEGGPDDGGEGVGGGGGGRFDATPIGFIEVGAQGAQYHEIPDPERHQRNLKAAASAATALFAGVAGLRRMTAGRRRVPPRRRLGR
jgi:uncharacterized spore protein YtfJ